MSDHVLADEHRNVLAPVSFKAISSKWTPSSLSATPQYASQQCPGVAVHQRIILLRAWLYTATGHHQVPMSCAAPGHRPDLAQVLFPVLLCLVPLVPRVVVPGSPCSPCCQGGGGIKINMFTGPLQPRFWGKSSKSSEKFRKFPKKTKCSAARDDRHRVLRLLRLRPPRRRPSAASIFFKRLSRGLVRESEGP